MDTPNTPEQLAAIQNGLCPDSGMPYVDKKIGRLAIKACRSLTRNENLQLIQELLAQQVMNTHQFIEEVQGDRSLCREQFVEVSGSFINDMAILNMALEAVGGILGHGPQGLNPDWEGEE